LYRLAAYSFDTVKKIDLGEMNALEIWIGPKKTNGEFPTAGDEQICWSLAQIVTNSRLAPLVNDYRLDSGTSFDHSF
jgi:hypothetical protein